MNHVQFSNGKRYDRKVTINVLRGIASSRPRIVSTKIVDSTDLDAVNHQLVVNGMFTLCDADTKSITIIGALPQPKTSVVAEINDIGD